jgi:thioester reductase-like protein
VTLPAEAAVADPDNGALNAGDPAAGDFGPADAGAMPPPDVVGPSVIDVLGRWVAAQPDKLLYAFLDVRGEVVARYTYREFASRVAVIASHLAARGDLRPGDRLLLAYTPGLEVIAAIFACAKAGLIAVPCAAVSIHGVRATLRQMSHILADSGAAAILTCREAQHALVDGGDPVHMAGVPWIVTDDLDVPVPAPDRPPHPVWFLQYTSGSTSEPKGVMVSHRNILHNRGLVVDHENIVAVTWLPQHHDMGLIGYYIYIALSGGTTYGFSPATFIERPALWLETITRYRGTASSAPNFAFELCLDERRVSSSATESFDLSSVRMLMAAAEPIRPDTYRRFLQRFTRCGLSPASFTVAYGLAEFTLAVSNHGRDFISVDQRLLAQGVARPVERASAVANALHLMSCGRPLGDTQVRIVDSETGKPLTEGRVGEIWLAGISKCLGYWGKPRKTAEDFDAHLEMPAPQQPFLRTGDMGFVMGGELFVCGRLKDMIIVRGENHFPQDIERVVEEHSPLIRRGAVTAFEVPTTGGEPGIVVVAELRDEDRQPDPHALARSVLDLLNVRVSRFMFVPHRSVEKTTSGKLRRFRMREKYLAGDLAALGDHLLTAPPAAATGDDIYELGVLRERYGLTGNEDFTLFDAGIDSLDLVVFLHWIKDSLARRGAPSVSEMVDAKLLGAATVRQIFEVGRLLESDPGRAISEIRRFLKGDYQRHLEEEQAMMRADRVLGLSLPALPVAPPAPARAILLTGATGFLGPYLLRSLLAQTDATISVLVRADSDEEAFGRVRDTVIRCGEDAGWFERGAPRIVPVCGDLEKPGLALSPERWESLASGIDTIFHSAALVNYLYDYRRMRGANVEGTREVLRLALSGRARQFNHVSTTFVFGWTVSDRLREEDNNDAMEKLDFGYSQSKWVSEQLVLDARRMGLPCRIFRPSLITPSLEGGGDNLDITLRLLLFMIKHGIGVSARNQMSLTPVDVVADNLVAIAGMPDTANGTFHLTRDAFEQMRDVTGILGARLGREFELFELHDFVSQVIRRCTREDPLFPLLDFLIGSVDDIAAMEAKIYDSSAYRAARDRSRYGRSDPPLRQVVEGILKYLERHHLA